MGWSIGYDGKWKRDIGYGVPAYCDHPGCKAEIDRGLAFVCGGEPHGGDYGCGLFVCVEHQHSNKKYGPQLCQHCADRRRKELKPAQEHPDWVNHKLTDESWQQWRDAHPEEVAAMKSMLPTPPAPGTEGE